MAATAERLRQELAEASQITKDTLACLLRRHAADDHGTDAAPTTQLDPRTVNYVHTIVHRAFKDAVRWGRLARNPADAADPPRGGQKSDGIHSWDAASLREYLASSSASGDRLHALWVLLATTGMRRGEALGLRWSDVDLDAGRLRVVQTIIQVRSKVTTGEPRTARGRRPIALDSGTIAVLREHRRRSLEERLVVGAAFEDRGLVFHRPNGSCLRPDAVSHLRPPGAIGRSAPAHSEGAASYLGNAGTGARHPPAGGAGAPRPLDHRHHSRHYSHVAPTLHDEAAQLVADLVLDAN